MKKRVRRTRSFFGLHFDFHAKETTENIGKNFKYEWIDELLEVAKPDYIQVDSKGHPGITSYPSLYGTSAPHMARDIMQAWREITKNHGVSLYAHYSGVFDSEAVKNNPDWAVVDKNGVISEDYTSVFGGYVDGKLLPQLKELAGKYELDGAWVDGECWGCRLDFSKNALKAFEAEYGRAPDYEKNPKEYLQFCRDGYWKYVRHYITEMKKVFPDFQITSNWAMSSYSPYIYENHPFTFLSGDLTWIDAVDNGARFEPRFLMQNGLPWDIMSWAFALWQEVGGPSVRLYKPAEQLMQEVSHSLALGGGVQLYFNQSPTTGLYSREVISVAKAVSEFCYERKAYCHKKKPTKEVGLLFSAKEYYEEIDEVMFTARKEYMEDFRFTNNLLLDNGYSVLFSVLEKNENFSGYKTLVLTNAELISDGEIERLLAFAKAGGNLVVLGEKSCARIVNAVGVSAVKQEDGKFCVGLDERFAECKTKFCRLKKEDFDEVLSAHDTIEKFYENDEDAFPIVARKTLGTGKLTLVPFAIGNSYQNRKPVVIRELLRYAIGEESVVQIKGTKLVDIVLSEEDDRSKRYVHLINNGGRHSSPIPQVFDEVQPLYGLEMRIAVKAPPKKVVLQPSEEELPFFYENGYVRLTLPKLHIYEILQIE